MLGWLSVATDLASRSKRAIASRSPTRCSGRTLIATSRSRRQCLARYTSPIPPAPRVDRISYGPSFAPGSSVTLPGVLGEKDIRRQDPDRLEAKTADSRYRPHGEPASNRQKHHADINLELRLWESLPTPPGFYSKLRVTAAASHAHRPA